MLNYARMYVNLTDIILHEISWTGKNKDYILCGLLIKVQNQQKAIWDEEAGSQNKRYRGKGHKRSLGGARNVLSR